jgi:hypothetical protein
VKPAASVWSSLIRLPRTGSRGERSQSCRNRNSKKSSPSGSEVGASVTRRNRPIEQADSAVLSYTATNLVTGVNGLRHAVQVDISLSYPGSQVHAEIINTISVETLPSLTEPRMHTDVITAGNESLSRQDQLDFRVTMTYPVEVTSGTYVIRLRIDGNYEWPRSGDWGPPRSDDIVPRLLCGERSESPTRLSAYSSVRMTSARPGPSARRARPLLCL